MIIKRLRLHNFGVYAGDNEFLFTNNKPIVLVGGMNGRGRRFFLHYMALTLSHIQRVKKDLMRSILSLLLIRMQKIKSVL